MTIKHILLPLLTAAGLFALAPAKPAAAEPALWKLTGPHATVYLFGTVHLLKASTQWHSPKIDAAFASASTLWEEISNPDDTAGAQPIIRTLGIDEAHPLSAQLDDSTRAKLTAFELANGLPAAQVDSLRPWLAAMQFQTIAPLKTGYNATSGVDIVLKAMADAQSKPVMGFETIQGQLQMLAGIPPKLQVDYLSFVLETDDPAVSRYDKLVAAWVAGDTVEVDSFINNAVLFARYPALYRTLLVDRNRAFAAKIEELLKGTGTSFVAVGTGHLAGADSVQTYLAKDGITAVRQ